MKIIFLDVDGPLIPARMYYKGIPRDPETARWIWDSVAVGMLNHLCEKYNARIVFNSSHNAEGHEYLLRQCQFNSLLYIHSTIHTTFPLETLRRIDGISKWLTYHGDGVTRWVVIDDDKVPTENLVHINFNLGITLDNYEEIVNKLGGEKESSLVL